ncbi:hypothetical protein GCM10010983_39880 [Caulobacter rhizosphaerae]|nr:hypothetical protein GCM10010983_39880 [Caulobacter rhizosphaerae]
MARRLSLLLEEGASAMSWKVEGFCWQAPASFSKEEEGALAMSWKVEGFCWQAPSGPRLGI